MSSVQIVLFVGKKNEQTGAPIPAQGCTRVACGLTLANRDFDIVPRTQSGTV